MRQRAGDDSELVDVEAHTKHDSPDEESYEDDAEEDGLLDGPRLHLDLDRGLAGCHAFVALGSVAAATAWLGVPNDAAVVRRYPPRQLNVSAQASVFAGPGSLRNWHRRLLREVVGHLHVNGRGLAEHVPEHPSCFEYDGVLTVAQEVCENPGAGSLDLGAVSFTLVRRTRAGKVGRRRDELIHITAPADPSRAGGPIKGLSRRHFSKTHDVAKRRALAAAGVADDIEKHAATSLPTLGT